MQFTGFKHPIQFLFHLENTIYCDNNNDMCNGLFQERSIPHQQEISAIQRGGCLRKVLNLWNDQIGGGWYFQFPPWEG